MLKERYWKSLIHAVKVCKLWDEFSKNMSHQTRTLSSLRRRAVRMCGFNSFWVSEAFLPWSLDLFSVTAFPLCEHLLSIHHSLVLFYTHVFTACLLFRKTGNSLQVETLVFCHHWVWNVGHLRSSTFIWWITSFINSFLLYRDWQPKILKLTERTT